MIGNGNVAADVARMLALNRDELAETDVADHALEVLAESKIEEIVVLGTARARLRPPSPTPSFSSSAP